MTEATATAPARRWFVISILIVVVGLLVTSPFWARAAISSLAFFRVRRVEVDGVRYLSPSDVVARLQVDTTQSVWQDLGVLEQRLTRHPQV